MFLAHKLINEEDVVEIMGSSFKPRERHNYAECFEAETDELTLEWLNELTRLQYVLGAGHMWKKQMGVTCGLPGGGCECARGHGFRENFYIADAPIRDTSGQWI